MLVGVIAFSFVSGAISSILMSYDEQAQRNLQTNMRLLNIFENFQLTEDV